MKNKIDNNTNTKIVKDLCFLFSMVLAADDTAN